MLCLDSVGRIGRDTHVLDWIDYLVLLAGSAAAARMRDRVFRDDASVLTVSLAAALCCLRLRLVFAVG